METLQDWKDNNPQALDEVISTWKDNTLERQFAERIDEDLISIGINNAEVTIKNTFSRKIDIIIQITYMNRILEYPWNKNSNIGYSYSNLIDNIEILEYPWNKNSNIGYSYSNLIDNIEIDIILIKLEALGV